MTAFDYAWSVIKADETDLPWFKKITNPNLSQEEFDELLEMLGQSQQAHQDARDSGQIYPQGNLPEYHPAIYGLMARKRIQNEFNDGLSREQHEHQKQFEDYPGEMEDWYERDDFQDELEWQDPFMGHNREEMNMDEILGNIRRQSMGNVLGTPSDEHIDAQAVQRLMEESRPFHQGGPAHER